MLHRCRPIVAPQPARTLKAQDPFRHGPGAVARDAAVLG
jgi:hypothetical protein